MNSGNHEILLGSISIHPAGIPITEVLGITDGDFEENRIEQIINGCINGIQLIPDPSKLFTPEDFAGILQHSFHIQQPVRLTQIPFDNSDINEHDRAFAGQFGYMIMPLASARVTTEGFLEAWIGPTLVHKDHPLASAKKGNHLHIETSGSTPNLMDWKEDFLLTERQIVTAHYIRCTVDNRLVLSDVLKEIAKPGLNVCEFRQPESREGEPTEIALLLDPSRTGLVYAATTAIAGLSTWLAVNSIHRVLGNPTQDISRSIK